MPATTLLNLIASEDYEGLNAAFADLPTDPASVEPVLRDLTTALTAARSQRAHYAMQLEKLQAHKGYVPARSSERREVNIVG